MKKINAHAIGWILTVLLMAPLAAGQTSCVVNGTFDDGLSGWTVSPEGVCWAAEEGEDGTENGVARLYHYGGWGSTFSELSQEIPFPTAPGELSFDMTMILGSDDGGSETDVLLVTLGDQEIYRFDTAELIEAVLDSDPHVLADPPPVIITGEEGEPLVLFAVYSRNVTWDVSNLANQSVPLKFSLENVPNDDTMAEVRIDDVAVSEAADKVPPVVQTGAIKEMWPPNHKYRTFKLSDCISVTDDTDGTIDVDQNARIISIYSDEPEEVAGNGDGNTLDDIVIDNDYTFQLRAERQGAGNGRVYGITIEVEDSFGNRSEATFYLGTPHDKSGDAPVDDGAGAGYTKTNT